MPSTNTDERDGQDQSQAADQSRQTRIDQLIMQLAAIRPARGLADEERRRQIEADLVLLLEAEILSRRLLRRRAAATPAETTSA